MDMSQLLGDKPWTWIFSGIGTSIVLGLAGWLWLHVREIIEEEKNNGNKNGKKEPEIDKRDKPDPNKLLSDYRHDLTLFFRNRLRSGLKACGGQGEGIDKPEKSYVALDAKARQEKKPEKGDRTKEEEIERLPALSLVPDKRKLVILGTPGAGKSTFLSHLGLRLAQAGLGPEHEDFQEAWDLIKKWPLEKRHLLPVYVALGQFAKKKISAAEAERPDTLLRYIQNNLAPVSSNELSQNTTEIGAAIATALQKGQAMVLLDGLDEIDDKTQRPLVRQAVSAFAERYDKCHCVVTCRIVPYTERDSVLYLSGFLSYELAPLDREKQIPDFVDKWYRNRPADKSLSDDEVKRYCDGLLAAIASKEHIGELAENPLLLTVIALVYDNDKRKLPDYRVELYEKAIHILLYEWEEGKDSPDDGDKPRKTLKKLLKEAETDEAELLKALAELAYQAHNQKGQEASGGSQAPADIEKGHLLTKLAKLDCHHGDNSRYAWAADVIDTITFRAGLLRQDKVGDDGLFSFPHRTFREYLAGYHLALQGDFVDSVMKIAEDSNWREAILLAVGYFIHIEQETDKPLLLVESLCPERGGKDVAGWRQAWLAGAALWEIVDDKGRRIEAGNWGKTTRQRARDLLWRVRGRLVDLLEAGELSPKERAGADKIVGLGAGNILSQLGDPRFDANNFFLPKDENLGFIAIPGGEFTMGSADNDKDAYGDEKPAHRVELSSYWIGKYPVTVAQFRAFIDAEHGGKWGEEWRKYNTADNHPVRFVSWKEADEYCRWLTGQLREQAKDSPAALPVGWAEKLLLKDKPWQITLPTEAQWELAARGKKGRKWPWGEAEITPDRANYDKTQIGGSSPVGCFLAGATPEGLADMTGNVWEFCSDWYNDKYYAECKAQGIVTDPAGPDQGGSRAIRGGGWINSGRYCRPAIRYGWRRPDERFDFGFRLAFSQVFSQAR